MNTEGAVLRAIVVGAAICANPGAVVCAVLLGVVCAIMRAVTVAACAAGSVVCAVLVGAGCAVVGVMRAIMMAEPLRVIGAGCTVVGAVLVGAIIGAVRAIVVAETLRAPRTRSGLRVRACSPRPRRFPNCQFLFETLGGAFFVSSPALVAACSWRISRAN